MIIYLISVLDNIKAILIVTLVLSIVMILAALDSRKNYKQFITTLVIFFISLISVTFIPNEKTMYLIYGEHLAKQVANSDEGKVILDKMLKIINNKLDEQLDSTSFEPKVGECFETEKGTFKILKIMENTTTRGTYKQSEYEYAVKDRVHGITEGELDVFTELSKIDCYTHEIKKLSIRVDQLESKVINKRE